MTEYERARRTMVLPKRFPADVCGLRDFARQLDSKGRQFAFTNEPLVEKEHELRKAKQDARAKLAQAERDYKKVSDDWRSARNALTSASMSIWMERMENSLGDILKKFADAIGDVSQMAVVFREFIDFFGDPMRWRQLYIECETKERLGGEARIEFKYFREKMDVAWGYMAAFTVSDNVKWARVALLKCLAYWVLQGGGQWSLLSNMKQSRDAFFSALTMVNEELKFPETFFVQVEKEMSRTGTEAQPKKAEAVIRAKKSTAAKPVKPKREVLLDVHRKISKFGYKVEGDRKTMHFGEKSYRLTAPIVVKKVNEMIKVLSENGKDVYVPFPVKVLNQFHREPYASFLRECIKRKTKQGSDPDEPILMPEARLRVKGEV